MFENIFRRFKNSDIVGKYIFANVAVFVFVVSIAVFSILLNAPEARGTVVRYFELPASPALLLHRPWTIFTYMFLHVDLWHILWNMIALYVFGKIFLKFYSMRHFVGFYILGGILGGAAYVLAFNLFPYFAPVAGFAFLTGASASVLAIVVGAAVRSPGYRINLLFFGSVKLSTFALVTVLISFLMISGNNAGGNFAHLGGAFAGWLVAYLMGKGTDLTKIVNKPVDLVSCIFRRRPAAKKKKSKFRYTANCGTGGRASDYQYNARKRADEAEIDKILEKIKKGGYASLSEEEKKRLFDASGK